MHEPEQTQRTMNVTSKLSMLASALVFAAFGCAAPGAEDAPSTEDGLEPSQLVTSGSWTAYAQGYSSEMGDAFGAYATFTGPANTSRKVGTCALRQYLNSSVPVTCTTAADCGSAPSSLPTGGARYCTAPDGVGTKKCFYRPGSATSYCAGSPALGGAAMTADSSGYVWLDKTVSAASNTRWISYACFEGCAATDPSSSSTVVVQPSCKWVGGVWICQ